MKRNGLKEVAELAGVSLTTAARVMRGEKVVKEKTVLAVSAAAAKLGYVSNSIAGSLKSQRSNLIAIVVPTFHGSVFAETIAAVSDTLKGTPFQLIIGQSSYDLTQEEMSVSSLLRRRPDGLILVGTNHSETTKLMLLNAKIPIVEIWDLTENPIGAAIGFSNTNASFELTTKLIAKGYSRFGLITGPVNDNNRASRRVDGFRAALADNGLKECWSRIIPYEMFLGRMLDGGNEILKTIASRPKIDCLFCTNELSAISAVVALKREGYAVPSDVAVVGFGDVEMASLIEPSLTTVVIPGQSMGELAAKLILDTLASNIALAPSVENIGFSIAWRGSA